MENWEKLIGDWGRILTKNFKTLKCGMISTPKVCIQTYQVRDIEETTKVMIDNRGYWIKLKESKVCFKAAKTISQDSPGSNMDNQLDVEGVDDSIPIDETNWISNDDLTEVKNLIGQNSPLYLPTEINQTMELPLHSPHLSLKIQNNNIVSISQMDHNTTLGIESYSDY